MSKPHKLIKLDGQHIILRVLFSFKDGIVAHDGRLRPCDQIIEVRHNFFAFEDKIM